MAATSPKKPRNNPMLPAGSRVVLVVSRGPAPEPGKTAQVPSLVGRDQGGALSRIEAAGLRAQVFSDFSAVVRRGEVVDQFPAAGTVVLADSEVVVLISNGPSAEASTAELHDVVGLSEADAVARLHVAGFEPEVLRDHHHTVAAGIVAAQLPTQASLLAETPGRSSRVVWLWAALAVVVVALVVAGSLLFLGGKQVTVPDVSGMGQAQAGQTLASAQLKLGTVTTQAGSSAPEGSVISQLPPAGSHVAAGAVVSLVLASSKPRVAVPTLVGLSESDAVAAIGSAGLTTQEARKYSNSVAAGTVIDQSPSAGAQAEKGSAVTISISLGTQATNASVPEFVGMSQADAAAKAVSLGLTSRVTNQYSSSVTAGTVVDQLPASGQSLTQGAAVGLSISLGPAPAGAIQVPDVNGQTSANANSTIAPFGLTMVTVQWSATGLPADTVVAQLPKSGTPVASGGSVLVFVSTGN